MNIQANLKEVLSELPANVRLVAVSKFHPQEAIMEAYQAGQRIFGESKIKYMAPYVAMIHGVDSYKLLADINKQAAKCNRRIPCLLQLHIAQEETKFGFSFDECTAMLETENWKSLDHVALQGVMGMASNTDNMEQVKNEFQSLHTYFQQIKKQFFADAPDFKEISMGMSHDYPIALQEGSTMIRVGSKIFGERVY